MGNTPNIRFKGFTDDWEQRKLGDWGDFYYGRSCPKWSVTEDATIPCIRYGELYTKFGAKIDRVYSYTNMPPENLRFSKGTEVLIPRVGENPMDYNHCTWLSMKDVAIGEMISVFNTDNNPLFTATMFNATLQNEFAMRVEGGSVTNLYFEKLKNIDVSFPSIREQEMIAAYFENIDNLITLHQRKCDETKKLKKFMLQKMFPKKDAKKPEIRFAGFTNDWEQRKFANITMRESTVGVSSSTYPSVEYEDVIAGEGRLNKDIKYKEQQKTGIVFNGTQILYGKLRPYLHNWLNPDFSGIAVGDWWVLKPVETDKSFIYRLIQTQQFDDVANQSAGSKMPRADWNLVSNTEFRIPKTSEEQMAIGTYFSNLDHLITLHQRKCDELKEFKKYMLQNMFPQKG
ncbi:restriction endonuclease subunit S [Lachnospira hominis (ex Liu et al. 2021)]|uniref:Restriction endonuclease subunit S n=1 Tax=Lachnospira hominis (ex Liu et al. 2021) TaxID=2763051 RepID=A0ABR7FY97_9FIRM|nr:restriction endonuclease subunit S [Lachnospira hominis]MBC5679645.1 restriction endonuclease subunit S [Lachnospira hominis]